MRWCWLFLAACGGYSEADFVPAKTDAFCDLYLECVDQATLVFDGLDKDRCVSTYGPVFRAEQEQCKLVAKSGKQCVTDIAALSCPSDDASVDDLLDSLPSSCDAARKKCAGGTQAPDGPTDDAGL